ncbi:hypothetical protein ABZT49_13780 [Methylobacterium sp. EM32]|uniref:hypothetical protein n=1 Tax=Methylobacterium sp. EM32 TaxID=3163481 RepID=UPI0033BDCCEE
MKTLLLATVLVAASLSPVLAAGCCGGKGMSMCAKSSATTMRHGKTKGCCCDHMSMNISKRR